MFAEINDLPADDPLRAQSDAKPALAAADIPAAGSKAPAGNSAKGSKLISLLPAKVVAAFQSGSENMSATQISSTAASTPIVMPAVQTRSGGVVVDARHRVQVPSFEGLSLRMVVEKADAMGLRVQPTGSGLAKEQAPAAGTSVPAGTEVVVRFSR
jgi:cell division protein FtsI (penicillin-binding protein 3)